VREQSSQDAQATADTLQPVSHLSFHQIDVPRSGTHCDLASTNLSLHQCLAECRTSSSTVAITPAKRWW